MELYGILKPSGNVIIYITVYYRQTDNRANLKYLRRHIVLGPFSAISRKVVAKSARDNLTFRDCRVHISSNNLSRNSCIITTENRTYMYEHTTKPQTYYGCHLRLTFHAPDSLPCNEIALEIFLTFKSFRVTVFNLLLEKYEKYE